ncbi:glycoside hydrolase family 32 protein [Anaerococcus tetradius]|uniref:Sucrose-6-phosphate hydrolase n=1 Tax=Anaerococcus tetradius TaxID=33036 RepID=A0A133KDC7_9FIRM|nr:glycoside hydrolase family 32 protein [Anaerococcus tetradius]KWZ77455.1 sucrose-6-phosphate hydrolase [Anaerococcus tetradius]
MFNEEMYLKNKDKFQDMCKKVKEDPLLQSFHIYPQAGWLNDPNGLCYFNGKYHIYFQYSPLDEKKSDVLWGHVSSPDFINYKREDPFIFPDTRLDYDGAYSGSAFVKDNKINFFYTGNVKHKGDFDYIRQGREHNTIKIISDGYNFDEKKLILSNDDYPSDMTKHVRDPKIYQKDGTYYMFLGARSVEDKGLVLVFKSTDLENFTYHMRIESQSKFGYMWECPDFFSIDDRDFLILCPQGLESEEYKYQNIYQAGYFTIKIDLLSKKYELANFEELDYGFDFYAPQSFEDSKGRRILIGWMGMPDANYTNPSVAYKWQHCLTIPRQLTVIDGKIYQNPIKELEKLRKEKLQILPTNHYDELVFEAIAEDISEDFSIHLRKDVSLKYEKGILELAMGKSSAGRTRRKVKVEKINSLRIYSDRSSIEIFINKGEYVLSTRVYSQEADFYSENLEFSLYRLNSFSFIE